MDKINGAQFLNNYTMKIIQTIKYIVVQSSADSIGIVILIPKSKKDLGQHNKICFYSNVSLEIMD